MFKLKELITEVERLKDMFGDAMFDCEYYSREHDIEAARVEVCDMVLSKISELTDEYVKEAGDTDADFVKVVKPELFDWCVFKDGHKEEILHYHKIGNEYMEFYTASGKYIYQTWVENIGPTTLKRQVHKFFKINITIRNDSEIYDSWDFCDIKELRMRA